MEGTQKKFKFAIDRGGTFTDVFSITPEGKIVTLKLLSRNPEHYSDAPTYAIKKIIAQETNTKIQNGLIDPSLIEWIRMGTTVATNALLESKGEKFCLLITKGFRDLLYIGNQSRPNLFDLTIQLPKCLYEEIIEVEERVVPFITDNVLNENSRQVNVLNNQKIEVFKELDLNKLEKDLKEIIAKKSITSIAVLLMHSYMYNDHENQIKNLAIKLGLKNISLSHQISPMIRAVPRGLTTCIDAYLTPSITEYLNNFKSSFSDDIKVLFMQSDGGLTSINNFTGCRAILSGPAGGVVGYALTSFDEKLKQPVIGFDMGGTSTDVSRYDGKYDHVFETITAGYSLQTPQLDINTIAAGGGSMLFFQAGMFVVGPESAGSDPGPACYKKDGPLTITDANLLLGRLIPEYFPAIFGEKQNEEIDFHITKKKFEEFSIEINEYQSRKNLKKMTVEEIALGFIKVANEAMCRPIRNLTEGKGYDTRKHNLACFGGAGGQHACAIARALGIKKIILSKYCGILSAYGLSLADVVREASEPCMINLNKSNMDSFILKRVEFLEASCIDYLIEKENFSRENIQTEVFLNLRYDGTDTGIMCSSKKQFNKLDELNHLDFEESFLEKYKQEYGFILNRLIFVDDIRIRGIGKSIVKNDSTPKIPERQSGELKPKNFKNVYFDGQYFKTNIYDIEDFLLNDRISGPAVIIDKNSTILVEPDSYAYINNTGDILIEIDYSRDSSKKTIKTDLDTTQLSIFSHRFMSIAEQMGRILQRTSVSTNIKERLDFSCAMFDSTGGLVANAPHIPVHLGAMQEAVKFQINHLKLNKGDVILTNHPNCGGSHLPDLTIITPVFNENSSTPVFYVANRGHHADIGGISPGSMPPNSTHLWQEGAVFKSVKIVENGDFKEKEIIEAFEFPKVYPGCSGSRNLLDNISDLKAQIAANQKGIDLINQLIEEYRLDVVLSYMSHIQQTAENSVRNLMKEMALKSSTKSSNDEVYFYAQDFMDGGSNIDLLVTINKKDWSATFDFTGTGYQVNGNCNAPRAITLSAIIYCIRSMLKYDIPLNQGCLKPINVIIPDGSILSPHEDAAVVGGNVLTSQRIVDVIFKAFMVCGASQGCMNNITFGNSQGGYYETVGGGAGAGPNWNGRSGIHTHMTNTRITDVEILEIRYPVVIKKFCLRESSGGRGQFSGGDGLIREYLFKDKYNLCVLTERRVFRPYGLNGGESGMTGKNILVKKDGRIIDLGSKSEIAVEKGDLFSLQTPGGGGYGELETVSMNENKDSIKISNEFNFVKGSLYNYNFTQNSA